MVHTQSHHCPDQDVIHSLDLHVEQARRPLRELHRSWRMLLCDARVKPETSCLLELVSRAAEPVSRGGSDSHPSSDWCGSLSYQARRHALQHDPVMPEPRARKGSVALILLCALTPELSRTDLRRRVWFDSENLTRRREAVSA